MDIFFGVLLLIVSVLLIIVVLLQKGRGGGLGAAFGGAGSSAFGTRTGDVLTWITIALTVLFLLLAMICTKVFFKTPGQVAMPTAWPNTQYVKDEGETRTMRTSTPSAKLVCTTDGSEPDPEAKGREDATQIITVKPGMTLKSRAFRNNWEPSELFSVTYLSLSEKPVEPTSKPAPGATTTQAAATPAPDATPAPAGS